MVRQHTAAVISDTDAEKRRFIEKRNFQRGLLGALQTVRKRILQQRLDDQARHDILCKCVRTPIETHAKISAEAQLLNTDVCACVRDLAVHGHIRSCISCDILIIFREIFCELRDCITVAKLCHAMDVIEAVVEKMRVDLGLQLLQLRLLRGKLLYIGLVDCVLQMLDGMIEMCVQILKFVPPVVCDPHRKVSLFQHFKCLQQRADRFMHHPSEKERKHNDEHDGKNGKAVKYHTVLTRKGKDVIAWDRRKQI